MSTAFPLHFQNDGQQSDSTVENVMLNLIGTDVSDWYLALIELPLIWPGKNRCRSLLFSSIMGSTSAHL